MVPLIAASKKRIDADTSTAYNDVKSRTKLMITKCLNRITTETEISAAHVSHFLLGNSDNKTSHKFTKLNLHSALAWLANEIKLYEESVNVVDQNEDMLENPDNLVDPPVDDGNDVDNDEDDEDDDNDESTSYTIATGNEGYVFVNQITDYLNRGEALEHMCLYEYCPNVYKAKFTEEEVKKNEKTKKTMRRCEQRHKFSIDHPQSETHWQKVRLEGNNMVPTLSKLPPSSKNNKDKYQKCVLLLFKPFTTFEELFNGVGWNETFLDFIDVTEHKTYIENIEELHIGIEEKKENDDENDEDNDDMVDEIIYDDSNEI